LRPREADRIATTFYGPRGLGVMTSSSLTLSLSRLVLEQLQQNVGGSDTAKAGAEGPGLMVGAPAPMMAMSERSASAAQGSAAAQLPAGVALRDNFVDAAYWNAAVTTDADGRAALDVKLPDNLTTWVVRAVGVTTDTKVGEATIETLVTKPLLIRPVTPRFFVVGDRVRLAASVTNQTSGDLDVEMTLASTGLSLEGPAVQTLAVPAGSERQATWWVTVGNIESVDLAFSAVAGGLSDAARPRLTTGPEGTIPVYRYNAPETIGTAGDLRQAGSRTETIALPADYDAEASRLDVRLDVSLAAAMREGLGYLEHFEYECTEQVVSRFLPNVLTYRALRLLGIEDADLAARLHDLVLEGLEKLYVRQNSDGGWGWWDGESSSPYLTAYAMYALLRLQESDTLVRSDVVDRAGRYLETTLVSEQDLGTYREANRQAWVLYVLSLAGRSDPAGSYASQLFGHRAKLSHYGKAYLAMALDRLGAPRTEIDTLLSDLVNASIQSATGMHWEEADYDWWAMNTDTRSTGIILDAFVELDPKNALLPNVVRWLMVARKGGIWETTQETAWSLVALTDWMVATGELDANYTYGLL
ncbi:MAG: alpha-2-macroglobulin, partial [Candidatus Bipolaricaulota bacterium]|nr:alpha-2-macroglobulin [Candidatus Bipolaricaulota bacterium]